MHLPAGRRAVVSAFAESPEEALDTVLSLEDQPAPVAPQPHEVVVAVRAAAVGWVDLLMTSGQYQHMPKPPYTPGLESPARWSGRTPESGVSPGDAGDRRRLVAGPRSLGPYQGWGGFASYVVAPAPPLLPHPRRAQLRRGRRPARQLRDGVPLPRDPRPLCRPARPSSSTAARRHGPRRRPGGEAHSAPPSSPPAARPRSSRRS
jgi:hypothetical protein